MRYLEKMLLLAVKGIDPSVIGVFQIILYLLPGHSYCKQLVFVRIDREQIVIYQSARLDASVEGERSRKGNLRPGRIQAKSMDKMLSMIGGGTTVLFVSHSVEQVKKMCDTVVWLDHGVVQKIGGKEVCDEYANFVQYK
jgi:hypothetical protein